MLCVGWMMTAKERCEHMAALMTQEHMAKTSALPTNSVLDHRPLNSVKYMPKTKTAQRSDVSIGPALNSIWPETRDHICGQNICSGNQ